MKTFKEFLDEAIGTKVNHPIHGQGKVTGWSWHYGDVKVKYKDKERTHPKHEVEKLSSNFPKSWGKVSKT